MSSISQVVIYIDGEIRDNSNWDPDGDACSLCEKPFPFSPFSRKHHCRSCGICACDSCAPYTIALTKNKIETCKIRICTVCTASSLAVSPLSRPSFPALPSMNRGGITKSQEPMESNSSDPKASPKTSPGPSSSSDPSASPLLRPTPFITLKIIPLDDSLQGLEEKGLKTPPRVNADTAPPDPVSTKRGSIASNATVFEGSEDGRIGYTKTVDAERALVPVTVSPSVRSPSSMLAFRLPSWVSSASSIASSSRRSISPSKRSTAWRARSTQADIINVSTQSLGQDELSCTTGSSFSDDSSFASGYTAPDIDDRGRPQHQRSTNDPTGRFSFSSLQGALYDYPVDDTLYNINNSTSNTYSNIGVNNTMSTTRLLASTTSTKQHVAVSSSSPHSLSHSGHMLQSPNVGIVRQPTPLHNIRMTTSSRASVGGASRVSNSSASSIVVVKCSNCTKSLRTGKGVITVAGKSFCSKNCAYTSDYLDKAAAASDNSGSGGVGGGDAATRSGLLVRSEKERQKDEREIAHALTQRLKGGGGGGGGGGGTDLTTANS